MILVTSNNFLPRCVFDSQAKKWGKNHIYWFLPWAQIPQKLSEKLSSVPNKYPNKTEIHSSHILSCFFFPHSITHSPLPKNNHYLYFDILPSWKFLISYCFNNWYFYIIVYLDFLHGTITNYLWLSVKYGSNLHSHQK